MAAAPDLHESFWVAIAAAAPVIGLASVVSADQVVRRAERATDRALRDHMTPPVNRMGAVLVANLNIVVQAFLLGLALYYLSSHSDSAGARLAALSGTAAGMFLVFLPTAAAWGRERKRHWPPRRDAGSQGS